MVWVSARVCECACVYDMRARVRMGLCVCGCVRACVRVGMLCARCGLRVLSACVPVPLLRPWAEGAWLAGWECLPLWVECVCVWVCVCVRVRVGVRVCMACARACGWGCVCV